MLEFTGDTPLELAEVFTVYETAVLPDVADAWGA